MTRQPVSCTWMPPGPRSWAEMAQRVKPRSKAEVTAFFDGLDLVDPGVIRCPEGRPDRPEDAAGKSTVWGGVAEKPASPQG